MGGLEVLVGAAMLTGASLAAAAYDNMLCVPLPPAIRLRRRTRRTGVHGKRPKPCTARRSRARSRRWPQLPCRPTSPWRTPLAPAPCACHQHPPPPPPPPQQLQVAGPPPAAAPAAGAGAAAAGRCPLLPAAPGSGSRRVFRWLPPFALPSPLSPPPLLVAAAAPAAPAAGRCRGYWRLPDPPAAATAVASAAAGGSLRRQSLLGGVLGSARRNAWRTGRD